MRGRGWDRMEEGLDIPRANLKPEVGGRMCGIKKIHPPKLCVWRCEHNKMS